MDGLCLSFDFQLFQSLYQAFGDHSKHTYDNWYHHHIHVLKVFHFSSKVLVFIFHFLKFLLSGPPWWQSPLFGRVSFLLVLVLVLAFTLVGLNRLPPEEVQHLEPLQPTFADPEPGHTKWCTNRNSIAEDQLLGDLIVLLGHPWLCWPMSSAAHRHYFAS